MLLLLDERNRAVQQANQHRERADQLAKVITIHFELFFYFIAGDRRDEQYLRDVMKSYMDRK